MVSRIVARQSPTTGKLHCGAAASPKKSGKIMGTTKGPSRIGGRADAGSAAADGASVAARETTHRAGLDSLSMMERCWRLPLAIGLRLAWDRACAALGAGVVWPPMATVSPRLSFGILGPLEVMHDGRRLTVGGPKQRAVLAMLLLHANRVVARER